ncbi:hypothetical protein OOK41_21340 [Micromonospora sp. NBC_01655]|uniref:hypothetical protein n=1 Tax=Micromonospora sp. NBC_01655 TaxID=2975983 RepID=UPI00224E5DE6|nr:hypothetical protein [Micromonospora sp. NBC_01655]MCX4472824.1 hypothetical protein [Micromonospora sp. NBC_01655]
MARIVCHLARRPAIDFAGLRSPGGWRQEDLPSRSKKRLLDLAEAERVPVEETTRAVPDRRWRRDQR